MKLIKPACYAFAVAAIACFLSLFVIFSGSSASAYAQSEQSDGEYSIISLQAEYSIGSDGYIKASEKVAVNFSGAAAFTRSLSYTEGARLREVAVYLVSDGEMTEADYYIETGGGEICLTIGGDTLKIGEYDYILEYDCFMYSDNSDLISIACACGWGAAIESSTFKVNLPFTPDENNFRILCEGQSVGYTSDGDSVFFSLADGLAVTLQSEFFTVYSENYCWFALIASAALIALIFAVKLIFFNRHRLKAEKSFKAAQDMDPLLMGKLIDNKANDCDVAALIFYWANRGFINIDLSDAQKPILTKVCNLPAMAPDYEQKLFYRIFSKKNCVRVGETGGTGYYKTAENVKKSVDEKTRGCYSGASMGVSLLFAVLGALTLGIYPVFFSFYLISSSFAYLTGFVFLLPPLIVYALTETLLYNRFKFDKTVKLIYSAIIIALCAAGTAVYVVVLPDFILETLPKVLISILAYAIVICSTLLISRTPCYNERLGEILGVRKFILAATEPDMRDLMKNVQDIFFIIYPYAITLNLDEYWADKFGSTKMKTPENYFFGAELINGSAEIYPCLKTACSKIINAFVAAPEENRKRKKYKILQDAKES